MRIVIAGAGAVGVSIATELLAHGHEVTMIDQQTDKIQVAAVAEADWILADACAPDSLKKAEVDKADVMVAATGDDKANLVISLLAKTEFAVPRTVARVNSPKNEWMFNDTWGVDVSVSTPRVMTSLVEEAVAEGTPVHLFTFYSSGTSIFSLTVPHDAKIVGRRLPDLEIPHTLTITAVIREHHPLHQIQEVTLQANDKLLILTADSTTADLDRFAALFSVDAELPFDPAQED